MSAASASSLLYFDYNATTPLLPEVVDAMLPFLSAQGTGYGNPSSSHALGALAKDAIATARQQVATLLGASSPDEVIFLSGASESINYALKGAAFAAARARAGSDDDDAAAVPATFVRGARGLKVVTSAVEHVAVLETCAYLASCGFEVVTLDVDECGRVAPDAVRAAVDERTVLVSIMAANNEVGCVNPIADLVAAAKEANPRVLFHTDASQFAGKVSFTVDELGVDMLTLAGHKIYAPKGVGALYVRGSGTVQLEKWLHGAGHERGWRAGTENTPYIVALGKACEIAHTTAKETQAHFAEQRDGLYDAICAGLRAKGASDLSKVLRVNGAGAARLPNTLSISFHGIRAPDLMQRINHRVACSAGAACHEVVTLSHVLQAMKVDFDFAQGTLRLSTGMHTTSEQVQEVAELLVAAVAELSPHATDGVFA